MKRLTTEQLARLKLIVNTLREIDEECEDIPDYWSKNWKHFLRVTRVKVLAVLASHGVVAIYDPPTPPGPDYPF